MARPATAAAEAKNGGDDKEHQEDKKQHLRHLHRNRRYTAKSEQAGDDCHYQKCNRP